MNAVFADIAGTLNGNTRETLNAKSISVLNEIVETTGSNLVIISSWRLHISIEEMRKLFLKYGFVGEIVGFTKDLFPKSRGEEVKQWVLDNNVNNYVILDDVDDYEDHKNVVFVDSSEGLDYCHLEQILSIMNQK